MHQPSYKQPDDTPDVIEREVDVPESYLLEFYELAEDLGALEMGVGAKYKAGGQKWRRVTVEIPPDQWRKLPTMPTTHDTPRIHPRYLT
jgi:hypothetical protein